MLAYKIEGSGIPVVLIHGFGEDSAIWNNLLASFNDEYQFIIPDLPGTGKTAVQSDLTIELMAASIVEILDAENIKKAAILGHSMGGYISLAFAEAYPEKTMAIALIHSTAFADSEAKKETRRKSIVFIRDHGTKPFLEASTPNLFAESNKELLASTIEAMIQRHLYMKPETLISFTEAMMKRPDRTAILKQADFPVLFILGREDQAVPFTDTMQQVYLPELSYIYILDKSGHMGMLEEQSLFNKAVHEFLSYLPR